MLIEYLKNVPLFNHLKATQLKELATRCARKKYRKGDVIFYKTDQSTELYIVLSGKLKVVLTDEEGDEMVLAQLGAGDFFGELSLIDGKGRSATIASEEESELAVLSKEVFFDLLERDPKIAVELMITLVERLRKADDMIESLAFLEVGERLIRALLENATAKEPSGGVVRTPKLTHKEISARIGSSREAVSKCMKMLSSKGLIREEGGEFVVAQDAVDRLRSDERR